MPIEPYLKFSSSDEYSTGTVLNRYHHTSGTRTPMSIAAAARMYRPHFCFFIPISFPSKCFEVFEKCVFLRLAQFETVPVAGSRISGERRVESKKPAAFGFRDRRNKADILLIENIVAAVKNSRALIRRIEKVTQRGNRSVVQVGSAQPYSIQRHVRVAIRFTKLVKPPRISCIQGVLIFEKLIRVGVEAVAICANLGHRNDMAHVFSAEIAAALTVTIRAVLDVYRFSLRGQRGIDWVRILRRRRIQKPVFNSFDSRQIDCDRSDAGSQCRALVAFLYGCIVAVPMQLHALTMPLLPDGRQ